MGNLRRDHIVKYLREEEIERIALTWLREAALLSRPNFNIIHFVTGFLAKRLRKKDPLKFRFFDAAPGDDPAYVEFTPLTLHVDREIWELADQGDPEARFIIAHEIGHLILHDHFATAFSDDPEVRIKSFPQERSAEWQANTFAYYFLVPTHVVATYDHVDTLIQVCGVTRELAADRLVTVEATRPRSQRLDGDPCATCGNFTQVRIGATVWCYTCQRAA